MKKALIYSLIIYFQLIINVISKEIKILYKINDSIITNHDIFEEINYLVSLNKNLTQLNNLQLSSNAEKYLIREIIKRDEINKFYEINYEEEMKSEKVDSTSPCCKGRNFFLAFFLKASSKRFINFISSIFLLFPTLKMWWELSLES